MQSLAVRLGCALSMLVISAISSSYQIGTSSAQVRASELVYAAQNDGTIHVYDIDAHHREVRVIRLFDCCADVRGIAAAVPTQRLYVMYNRDGQGHVASLDL